MFVDGLALATGAGRADSSEGEALSGATDIRNITTEKVRIPSPQD
jgi:hypothetical protein